MRKLGPSRRLQSSSDIPCKWLCPLTKLCRLLTGLSLSFHPSPPPALLPAVSVAVGLTSVDFGHGCNSLPTLLGFLCFPSSVGWETRIKEEAGRRVGISSVPGFEFRVHVSQAPEGSQGGQANCCSENQVWAGRCWETDNLVRPPLPTLLLQWGFQRAAELPESLACSQHLHTHTLQHWDYQCWGTGVDGATDLQGLLSLPEATSSPVMD